MITDIGKANHIFSDGSIVALDIKTIEFEKDRGLKPAVTISDEDGNGSIMIHDLQQWEQMNALVRKAFDGLE